MVNNSSAYAQLSRASWRSNEKGAERDRQSSDYRALVASTRTLLYYLSTQASHVSFILDSFINTTDTGARFFIPPQINSASHGRRRQKDIEVHNIEVHNFA